MEVGIWHEAASRKNAALTNAYIRARKRSGWRLQHDTSGFFKLRSYGEFSTRLQELCTEYSEKGLARLVTEKLYPHMDHILKLSLGITSAVQSCPYAPICWGAFLLVIYCGCSFAESLEAIIDQLSELERAIGYMEYDLHLYPMCKMQLQKPLCALFQDYLDFCIVIVEWMGHSVLANLSKALYSSALSRKLRPIKKSIEQNCKRFDQLVQKVSQTQTAELYRTVTGRCNLTADPVTFPLFEVRLQRNPDFVGRANQLSQLQQYLIRDGSQPKLVSCALEGVGGIGKTETALEFCYQQSCHYDAVFWVSAASQATLQTDFARIGRSLHLFDIEDDKVAAREIQVVLRWFQNEARRWLLVFDNVEDWHSIKKYWPCGSSAFGSIVATTQIRSTVEWTDHQIAIDPFEPAEGAELFLRKLRITNAGEKERAEACRLAELRAGIPLWMNFLAADIKNSPYSPEVWLEESNRGSPSKIEQTYRRESTRYERPPQEIFDNVLRSLSDDAKSLLYMLVFLNGDSIQEHILLAEHHCEELAFLNPKHRGRQAITELFRAWLLQRQDDHLSGGPILRIHRLTQEVLFERLSSDTETRQLALERVVQLIRECYPEPSKLMRPAEGTAALAFAVLPHILRTKSFFTMADPPMEGNIQLARLLIDVGNMDLYDNGRIADALSILELAEAILDRLGAPENNDCRGHILTVRGLCYDELGISKRHEGLRIRERCRSVRQQCFAQIPPDKADQEDEILLFNALTDYACSLQHANRFAEVEAICLQCIAQYRKWGPETDPALAFEYAKYYNHMAYVHLFRGDNAKAVGHARKGYEFMFRSQSNTQISLLFRFDWANVLFQTGNLDEAIRQHKIILQLRRDLCGEHNMRILQSHLNLGIILFFAKRFADACHHLKAVRQDTIAEWPIENKTRAGYYLGRSLLALDPMSMEGLNMRAESLRTMRRLLATDFLVESMGFAHDDEELLMDYLVEWELRLVTPHHSRPYQAGLLPSGDG